MNSGMNPYSDKYSPNLIASELKKYDFNKLTSENIESISILLTLESLNTQFKSYYKYLTKTIKDSKFSIDQYLSVSVGFVNGNYSNVTKVLSESLPNEYSIIDISEFSIKSIDKSIGNVNAISGLEAQIDDLNNTVSHLRYFKNEFNEKNIVQPKLDKESLIKESDNVGNAILNTSIYNAVKFAFEKTIWNDGNIKLDREKQEIYMGLNTIDLGIHRTGVARLRRLVQQFSMYAHTSKYLLSHFQNEINTNKENQKRIKNIKFVGGAIKYKLAKGNEKEYLDTYMTTYSEIVSFYSFILDKQLPSHNTLTVLDCIKLVAHLKLFFQNVAKNLNAEFENKRFIKFVDIPSKIHRSELRDYLTEKYNGQRSKVINFLSLISQELNNRISFWRKPLLKNEEYYYVPLLSITSPNLCYLIDEILESGGFNLDIRGEFFEEFIATELKNDLYKKKYFHKLYSSIKVYKGKKFEEIDLIIELKEIILLAEVKCIKYSMTGRDYASATKTLNKAAKQVKRKAQFIDKYKGAFDNIKLDINKKPILLAIINQYPLFTGTIIDGVPVLDFAILESYFKSGEYGQAKMEANEIQTVKSIKYYHNESTFNKNLKDYLISPIPIRGLLANIKYKLSQITPVDHKPSIFMHVSYIDEQYNLYNFGLKKGST